MQNRLTSEEQRKIVFFDSLVRAKRFETGEFERVLNKGLTWGIAEAEKPARARIAERRALAGGVKP